MIKFFNQKKIINVLFIAAVGILILNLLLDKFFLPVPEEENIEITSAEIDSTFRSGLFNLGIHEEWIKKQNKNSDNLSVLVPKDLPFVLILQEMNNVFDTNEVKIKSIEKKIGGRTTLNFISGEEEKLKADLIYNEKVRRKTVRVGFIVKRIDGPDETDSILTGYPEQFAFLLIPSNNSANFVKKVITSGKEYILYLNDEIGELKYRLKENYSAIRLKNSVREIVGTFPGAVFFMIDDKSRVYNSGVYPLLKDELEKRKIKLVEESSFKSLSVSADENLFEKFNNELNNLEGGEDKIYIITAENFLQLNSEIIRYRKLGYRFTNPSALSF